MFRTGYLKYISAICLQQEKKPSSRFFVSCQHFKTHTSDVQTMSEPPTLERPESRLLVTALVSPTSLQRERSAAVCAKRYCGISPRLRRMDIADTHVLYSAAKRWGRHTVNCRQNRKAESCEICILTATVHRSVKSHSHAR